MGSSHGGGVGVEDCAGEVAGFGAGDDFGDEGSGEALAAVVGVDEEALDVACLGLVWIVRDDGSVGDGGCGLIVYEGDEHLATGGSVRSG